jgi:dephospho-CoA kinase
MYLVGLTGGIGSGKSTVSGRFASLGCDIIDADQIAREIVEPGQPALDDLVQRFGRTILQADGSLDRAALAAIVFRDDTARRDLDRITHPRIGALVRQRIDHLRATTRSDAAHIVVVDHPLLIETGQAADFDAIVAVIARVDLRIARLRDERGMDEDDARARIRVQTDDATRRTIASHVVDNDGSLADLLEQVDAVHADLLREAGNTPR